MRREIAAALADRQQGWRFIERFAAEWASPLTAGDGWPESELDAAEQRLGLRLPAALREAYALFGRRDDLTRANDRLLKPEELRLEDGVLIFRDEHQNAWSLGILPPDRLLADPPVHVLVDYPAARALGWTTWMGRLSHTLIEGVLSDSLHGPDELTDYLDDLAAAELAILEREYELLPFEPFPTSMQDDQTRWFSGHEVLIREEASTYLLARARTPEALTDLRTRLPGTWLRNVDP